MKKAISIILLLILANNVLAENTSVTTIKWVKNLPDFNGENHFLIQVAELGSLFPNADCSRGLWIDTSAPGYDTQVSMILAAFHAKTQIIASIDKTKPWPGSSDTKFCKVTALTYGDVSWY